MANYEALKAALDAAIKNNQSNSITGDGLNSALDSMINALGAGYQYIGKATTSTNPGTPDFNVVYLAHNTTGSTATYTNFGNLTLAAGEIALLKYNGSWSKDSIPVDNTVTQNSRNLVTSGAVYEVVGNVESLLAAI